MSRVLGLIGMDWRMDGGTWDQARDRVARRLGRRGPRMPGGPALMLADPTCAV